MDDGDCECIVLWSGGARRCDGESSACTFARG